GDPDAVLHLQVLGDGVLGRVGDDLDQARGVTQVEEGDAAVVAAPLHPAGQGDLLTDHLGGDRGGPVGADHRLPSSHTGTSDTDSDARSPSVCASIDPSSLSTRTTGTPRRRAVRNCALTDLPSPSKSSLTPAARSSEATASASSGPR